MEGKFAFFGNSKVRDQMRRKMNAKIAKILIHGLYFPEFELGEFSPGEKVRQRRRRDPVHLSMYRDYISIHTNRLRNVIQFVANQDQVPDFYSIPPNK